MQQVNVVVINESSMPTLDAWNLAWGLDYAARFYFGPMWRISARVGLMPAARRVPAGAWVIHLVDTIDVANAEGFHDEDGHLVPYARVSVEAAKAGGTTPSEVAAHELFEMLVDPHVNLSVLDPKSNRVYAYEVGDPVQGNAWDVGALSGRTTGLLIADFALPNWFDPNTPADAPTSFRGVVKGPFALAPQGYMSWIDLADPSKGWQQGFGSERTSAPPPDLDDHLARKPDPGPIVSP